MVELDLQQKTEILKYTLQGYKDQDMVKLLSFGKQVSKQTIHYMRTKNSLPKRKRVLSFLIDAPLVDLSLVLEEHGKTLISSNTLCSILNSLRITNTQGKPWSSNGLNYYLQTRGVQTVKGVVAVQSLRKIQPTPIEEICEFDPQVFNPYTLLPDVTNINFEDSVIVQQEQPKLEDPESITYIKSLLEQQPLTYAEITKKLNEAGYTNKNGKSFGRWSVTILCNKHGICIQKQDVTVLLPRIQKYISTLPLTHTITIKDIKDILPSLCDDQTLYKSVENLNGLLQPLIKNHNDAVKQYLLDTTFKTKLISILESQTHPIRYDELAGMFCMSAMSVLRNCEKVGMTPTAYYYQCIHKIVKAFVETNPSFSMEDLSQHLNETQYLTPRGKPWEYAHTYIFYCKLKELYPELPDSIGSRNL